MPATRTTMRIATLLARDWIKHGGGATICSVSRSRRQRYDRPPEQNYARIV
jgi:hypothetical protein